MTITSISPWSAVQAQRKRQASTQKTHSAGITGGVHVYCYLETLHQVIFHLPCLPLYRLGKEPYLLLLNIFNSQNTFFIALSAKSELRTKRSSVDLFSFFLPSL